MKKVFSLLLVLMLCVGLFAFPALADNSVSIIMDQPDAPSGYSSGAYFAEATMETKSIKITEGFGAQKDLTVRVVTAKPGSTAYMLTNGEPDYTFSGSPAYDQYYYKLNSDGTYSEDILGMTFRHGSSVVDEWFISPFSESKTPSDMILIYNSLYDALNSGNGDPHENINTDYCFCVVLGDASPSAPVSEELGVTVNGKAVEWTDATPFIDENSRTLVPLRAVGDAMDLTVTWDNDAREAVFTSKDGAKSIRFPIGVKTAYTTEGTKTMDTAAIIRSDRTYAPARALAEYFGYTVGWDGDTKTVSITGSAA